MFPYGDQGAFGDMAEAAMDNMEAAALEGAIGPNPISSMLRMGAAVEEVEAVVDLFEGDL